MTDTKPKPLARKSWFSLITPEVLARFGSPHQQPLAPREDLSICTSRYPGEEPPEDRITVIARIR